ncbi:MAG: alpha/beta hydrolase [Clostridium sp.]|nr:alpha/beta hydrolase [Clostridium sp.]MCM1398303.1 alpha/beta hydrolase [Clostridium sp.]MCM1459033.1 alpha/beta hydrolase [Bacteroides sp.]
MEKRLIKARDGYELELHIFEVEHAKAVVQIVHGMEEHQERYEPFVKFLNENHFSVVSSDMRGHGKNAKDLGFFKDEKGYVELVKDQKLITAFIKKRFPKCPVYIFAHSMGTITTRVLLQRESGSYEKVILSGYPNYHKGTYFGIILADGIKRLRGAKYKSKLVNSLSIGAFNKNIKNPKTDTDWICYNEDTVRDFIDDPYCGFGFTCSGFSDLFNLVIMMHKKELYQNVNGDLPLLLLRGLDDPCVGGEKGAEDSRRVLSEAGFHNMQYIDYPDMRHEILNEVGNRKVYDDILKFYEAT